MKSLPTSLLLCAGVALATPVLAGEGPSCGAAPAKAASHDLVETARKAGSFKTLLAAVEAADLVGTLQGPGPFTVFAPADSAFAALPEGTVAGLLKDKAALRQVLTYHVVPGRLTAAALQDTSWATSVQGQDLAVTRGDGALHVDGARVVQADIQTSNGVIHVIDRVIQPKPDLVDTAVAAGSFQTLVTAVKAAGLVETLKGKGPFTVFAPTDAAFAKLPEGALQGLLDKPEALKKVLTFHVLPARVMAGDIAVGTHRVKTVAGLELKVRKTREGSVFVEGVPVTQADVRAGNGVIHVLGGVLLPSTP